MLKQIAKIASDPASLDQMADHTIHPDDQMYKGKSQHYFGCGRDAIRKICTTLVLNGTDAPDTILDFGCGYGRVTRYIRAAFADAFVVASDVMAAAVKFNAQTFGVADHLSTPDLGAVSFDTTFDLIWCGSLMTHLSEDKAVQLLNLFERSLKPNGIAIFTTHGRFVAERRHKTGWSYNLDEAKYRVIGEQFDAGAYAYTDYAHMKDYGISLTPMAWIAEHLRQRKGIRCLFFMERGWDNHQDVCAIAQQPII